MTCDHAINLEMERSWSIKVSFGVRYNELANGLDMMAELKRNQWLPRGFLFCFLPKQVGNLLRYGWKPVGKNNFG